MPKKIFFFSSRRRHTRYWRDWSSDVCSSDLCPTLEEGQVVVMDNLSSHKGERVRELIEGKGCELIYLPSYSPDFNPIEQAFRSEERRVGKECRSRWSPYH